MPKMLRKEVGKKQESPRIVQRKKESLADHEEGREAFSFPSSLTEGDWIANKDWITKIMKNNRNIDEVGSPEKTNTKLEEKKRRKEGEGIEKKD